MEQESSVIEGKSLQNSRWHKRVSIVMDLEDKEEILRFVKAIWRNKPMLKT